MTNKYARDVSHLKTLDPYRLAELYKMHPCAEHVVKKMLCAGERSGGKSLDEDIQDCIDTLTRWKEMRSEDAQLHESPDFTGIDSAYRFFATNEDGSVLAYTKRPRLVDGSARWVGDGIKVGHRERCSNWRDSLKVRL